MSTQNKLINQILKCSACSFFNPSIKPLPPALSKAKEVPVMFIGENPSWEKEQTEPFAPNTISGKALLNNYLKPLDLKRDDIWITDLFKCRYPKEIYKQKAKNDLKIQQVADTCSKLWLIKEMEFCNPEIIVTLSDREVYQRLRRAFNLSSPKKFSEAVGNVHNVNFSNILVKLFPMIHPDISRVKGDGDNRKLKARKKWSDLHYRVHLVKLKNLLQ